MPIKSVVHAVVRMLVVAMLLRCGLLKGQSTAGWLTYNGPNFSFNYPPDWKISAETATSVDLGNGNAGFSVTYATQFGTDINQALTSVETGTQQFATSQGYTVSAEPFVPGNDGTNTSVWMHLTGAGLAPVDIWAEARSVGSVIFITELIDSPDDDQANEVEVAWPLTRSVHSVAGLSVVGGWSASVPGDGELPTPTQFEVTLLLHSDTTYTYDVRQTIAPAWELQVSGSYTSGPANQNNDEYPLTLHLSPQKVTPTGVPDLHIASIYLFNSGLPVPDVTNNDFLAELDADGSLELLRAGGSPVRFQKAAVPITPLLPGTGPFYFVPVTPCRVADTRSSSSTFGRILGAGETRDFTIALGPCGVPSSAEAYSLNITAVPTKHLGYISVWPTGQAQPNVSTLNSYDGRFKANAVLVAAGQNGSVSVFSTDPTDIVLDINGYFVPAGDPAGLAFYPLTPCRISDTRNASGPLGGPTLEDKQTRTIPVTTSACGVPGNAQAYSLNFTAVPKGTLGYLSVWPTGDPQPYVSTLNAPTGSPTANAAIVPAGASGSIDVYVSQASDVVVDINGYFAPPAAGGLSFYGLVPCRVWDTRSSGTKQPLQGAAAVAVAGGSCPIPSSAQAVVFNATVVPDQALGFLSIWPDGSNQPLVSTLNSWDASVDSNMAIVPMTNGSVDVFSSSATHAILDVSGYFAP